SFLENRSWDDVYEGQPNTEIASVEMQDDSAMVTFRQPDGSTLSRQVRGLVYATGRRGSLGYLAHDLISEVLGDDGTEIAPVIPAQSLRKKALENLEVARSVFIIGSLTGDSLIRFAYGGCVQTAGRLIRAHTGNDDERQGTPNSSTSAFR